MIVVRKNQVRYFIKFFRAFYFYINILGSRKSDHHNDSRKRRHEETRNQKRDDERCFELSRNKQFNKNVIKFRFVPPPEEPVEEFDESLVVMDKYNSTLNIKVCLMIACLLHQLISDWSFEGSSKSSHCSNIDIGKLCLYLGRFSSYLRCEKWKSLL